MCLKGAAHGDATKGSVHDGATRGSRLRVSGRPVTALPETAAAGRAALTTLGAWEQHARLAYLQLR